MKINLIIATYSGMYDKFSKNIYKKDYLKYHLSLLNKIKTNITQITIMKPLVNKEHFEDMDYYNFNSIDISNIKNRIKIIECENIGISYGQFFTAINNNIDFDYHILLEDDYVAYVDYFENDLINELNLVDEAGYLCMFYYKNKVWNLIETMKYTENITTCNNMISKMNSFMENYKNTKNFYNSYRVPDISTGILSKKTISKILNKFISFDNISNLFNINFKCIGLYQILFGYILGLSDVNIYDTASKYMNLFYVSEWNTVHFCNVDEWRTNYYTAEKLKNPLFIPMELLYPYEQKEIIKNLNKYLIDPTDFIHKYNNYNDNIIKIKLLLN